MKSLLLFPVLMLGVGGSLRAALPMDHPGKGTDGALTADGAELVIDLGRASTGRWDAPPSAAGAGVYDPEKWAVVFKYSTVNIPAGTTVRFKNHPSRAPVMWLVDGDVSIAGVILVAGDDGNPNPDRHGFAEPGPGGFRGGESAKAGGLAASSGFGPGGGGYSYDEYWARAVSSGSFSTPGASLRNEPAPTYGSPTLIPLIGGSGGAGWINPGYTGTGAGGGAIAILASGRIDLNGRILATGGISPSSGWPGQPAGSGGAIRLVGESVAGRGTLDARSRGSGGNGWVVIEAANYVGDLQLYPFTAITPVTVPRLWPEAGHPELRIVAIGGQPAPADPRGNMGPTPADLQLASGSRTNVVTLESVNLGSNATVVLRVIPRHGTAFSQFAEPAGPVPGDASRLRWQSVVVFEPGFHALQARAIVP